MNPLIDNMTDADPSKRPTMDKVVERFEDIRHSLSWWKLRSRLSYRSDFAITRYLSAPVHLFRMAVHIARSHSAIPVPPEQPQHTFKV